MKLCRGSCPVSMEDFLLVYRSGSKDIRIDVWEALVHFRDVVWEFNNPFPFDPVDGWVAFNFFWRGVPGRG